MTNAVLGTYITLCHMVPNSALRSAIFESPLRTQRAVAMKARIHETRLSAIIRGREDASDKEKKRLATALDSTIAQLFGSVDDEQAVSA